MNIPRIVFRNQLEAISLVSVLSAQSFMYDLKCGTEGVVTLFVHLGKSTTRGVVSYTGSVNLLEEGAEVVIEASSSVDFMDVEEELGFALVLLSASLDFGKETLDFICKDIESFRPSEVLVQMIKRCLRCKE